MYRTAHRNTAAQNAGIGDGGPAWTREPASPGRVRLINTIIGERVVDPGFVERVQARIADGSLTNADAMSAVAYMKRQPARGGQANGQLPGVDQVPAGSYEVGSHFYTVKRPTEGKWAGRVFVDMLAYAPRSGQPYTEKLDRQETARVLETIVREGISPAFVDEAPAAPAAPRKSAPTITEEGFYLYNNEAFKVVRTKDGERFYAKRATSTGWDAPSARGIVYRLEPEMLMTPAQIAEVGVAKGFCLECSTVFGDPASEVVGLGPTCGPRILGQAAYDAAYKHAIETDERAAAHHANLKASAKVRREAKKLQKQAAAAEDARIAALQEGSPVDQAELHADLIARFS